MRARSVLPGLIVPVLAFAQEPVRLTRPDAAFAEPFTLVASVRELRDGRVLVLDRRDRIVLLVDFQTGKSTAVGREGTGPGEYSQPGRLFPLPGDTTAIYDGPARRFVIVEPNGKTGADFRMDVATGAGQRRGGVPKWSDNQGRIFTEGSPYATGPVMAGADSAAIARFARGSGHGDTVAWARLDRETVQIRNTPEGGVSVTNGIRAFAWRDDWVALPDGGVAVVRAADYHVDWVSPSGDRTAGRAVATARLPVTEADKDNARKERLAAMRGATTRGRPGTPPSSPPNEFPGLPELTFPAFKPPFEMGRTVARPNGELWVLRSRAANDRVAVYDVFTRARGLVRRVAFPPATEIIGFGKDAAYTLRLDDDDLQYLERWRLP
jgi:hypothetical protein